MTLWPMGGEYFGHRLRELRVAVVGYRPMTFASTHPTNTVAASVATNRPPSAIITAARRSAATHFMRTTRMISANCPESRGVCSA